MKNLIKSVIRECTHGEMIERLIEERKPYFSEHPVFVETGCGISTISLARCAKSVNASAYSLDYNSEKRDELISRAGDQVSNINFLIGDSLENLPKVTAAHRIDFLFLDSAASAMHTFQEFLVCEPALSRAACVLVDNAALPGQRILLSPVRKGKVLVPYLLASPFWEVRTHPRAGDSMISAIFHGEGGFADPDYEAPEYIDQWQGRFNKALP